MRFFDKIFRGKKEEKRSLNNSSNAAALLFGGVKYNQGQAMTLSAVYRCIDLISNTIAQMPVEIYRVDDKGFKTIARDHITYNVIRREPNAMMSANHFLKQLVTSALTDGNGYAYIQRNGNGECIGLQWIPSEYVTVVPSKDLTSITYNVVGKGVVESVNMIHITSGYTPNGYLGESPLNACSRIFKSSLAADKQAEKYYSSGCNLAGILTCQGMLTEEKKLQNKQKWYETFENQEGAGIAILDGNMTYTPISSNAADSQLLECRTFNISEVARVFGVPLCKLGDLSGSSQYGTLEEANNQFLTDCVQPWLTRIENEYERKLFRPSERESLDVVFDVNVILRTSLQSQADTFAKLFNIGVLTQNEIRRNLNLTPIEGGDSPMTMVNMEKNIPQNEENEAK